MKRTMTAIILGTALWPAVSFSHDGRRHDHDRWRHRYDRVARPGDPGYYCHTHKRKIHRDVIPGATATAFIMTPIGTYEIATFAIPGGAASFTRR